MYKSVSILGSTGSIGTQTLKVAQGLNIKVEALAAHSNIELLEEQIRCFKPQIAAVYDENKAKLLKDRVADTATKIVSGIDGVCQCATFGDSEIVLGAMSGMIGLLPTIEAIRTHKDIALANKETLVTAGEIVMAEAKAKGCKILPVDSEHNAIFQALHATKRPTTEVNRLILTASGGPFYGKTRKELEGVTKEQALKHPNWSMGSKITIDSATLMNKGLEIIEAMWLFDMPLERIDVLVHRQSIVHSMVEYVDGAVIAEMGVPDMCLPIQYALTYPNRVKGGVKYLDFTSMPSLTFEPADTSTFGCLKLAIESAKMGGTAPCAMNAANEVAVSLFLNDKITFLDIEYIISQVLSNHLSKLNPTLDDILKTDDCIRQQLYDRYRGEVS